MFDLDTLLSATHGHVARGASSERVTFTSGCFDSRQAEPGCLFFALRDRRDGHEFVADALRRGARAAVVARLPDDVPDGALLIVVDDVQRALRALAERLRAAQPIPAVGITGSVGKTTAKEAAAAAISARYRVLRSAASFNNEIGVPMTFLAQEPSHQVAVVELGFYVPGEIADLCRLVRPRIGIVTAVQPVHFARTPSVDAISRGKAELVESLGAEGVALLNADDPRVRAMRERTAARVVLFGTAEDAELRATDVRSDGLEGLRFTARWRDERAEVRFPLPGEHLVTAALAGVGAALALDVPLDEAAVAVGSFEPPAHRMAVRRSADLTVIDDAYNASPVAVAAALRVLGAQDGRRIAVLGDMLELGSLSAQAHRDVGRIAAETADALIGVGELSAIAVNEARRAGITDAHTASDNAEALIILRRIGRPGDVVLVKGSRALRMEEIVEALLVPAGAR